MGLKAPPLRWSWLASGQFQSPCGVMGLKVHMAANFAIELATPAGKFQSPCGVMGLKVFCFKILLTDLVFRFQSPCGVKGLKVQSEWNKLRNTWLDHVFQSPCGVKGLKETELAHLLLAQLIRQVSVPLRGKGFESQSWSVQI